MRAPPFFLWSSVPLQPRKRLAPLLPFPTTRARCLAFSLCSPHRYRRSCELSGSCSNVRASNLLSIKAMQREILLACQRNKRTSGESFEQVDR